MSAISDDEFVTGAYIQEGVSPIESVIIAACTLGDDYDKPKNRVGVRKGGVWLEFGLSGEAVLSVDATARSLAYVLGENGTIVRFDWRAGAREELRSSRKAFANPAVLPLGPLRRVRVLGDDVICAGSVGQAYCLRDEKFEQLPQLSIEGEDVTIEDIGGTGRNDIFAVTSDGHAAHFDGIRWSRLDLPTNASLTSICALGADRYAIAGKSGTVVTGSRNLWQIVPAPAVDRSYWGVGTHDGFLYVAHLGGIDQLIGGALQPLKLPTDVTLQFTVLRNGIDGVWSFADRTIGVISKGVWTTILS